MSTQLLTLLLALVAVNLLMLAAWRWREERSAAMLWLVGGLVLGALTAIRIWPALIDEARFFDREALRRHLTETWVKLAESERRDRNVAFILFVGWYCEAGPFETH